MEYTVEILKIEKVTHDVNRFVVERPAGFKFKAGEVTSLSINKEGFEFDKRPITFSGLEDDKNLEFTIKIYPEHEGVTAQLDKLKKGDELIISDPWGKIEYKDEGVFVAGGAGVTPFIAILRKLKKEGKVGENILIFSNKTSKDIILEKELKEIFKEKPENLVLVLTREKKKGMHFGRIDYEFLKSIVNRCPKNFYVCGPATFVSDVNEIIERFKCKQESIVFEK